MMVVHCPSCGHAGTLHSSDNRAANDDEDPIAWTPPEGFRKVQVGSMSHAVHLFCVDCGVAAQRGPVALRRLPKSDRGATAPAVEYGL